MWSCGHRAALARPHLYTYFLIYRHKKSVLIHNTSSFPGLNNFDFSFYLVKVIGIGYRSPYGLHLNYLNSCNLHTNVHLQLFGYLSTLNYSLYYTLNQSQENQCIFLAIINTNNIITRTQVWWPGPGL